MGIAARLSFSEFVASFTVGTATLMRLGIVVGAAELHRMALANLPRGSRSPVAARNRSCTAAAAPPIAASTINVLSLRNLACVVPTRRAYSTAYSSL